MAALKPLSDIQLLVGSHADPELFGEFYVRHLPSVTRYLLSSCGDRELTADLTAEVFAAALKARDRFSDEHGSALPWLLTIAKNKLTDCRRRGKADVAARRSLGVCAIPLENDDLARVEELAD